MNQVIRSRRLTTCGVTKSGAAIHLNFIDSNDEPVALVLSGSQAQSLIAALPGLLTQALKLQVGGGDARVVFQLGGWSIEPIVVEGRCMTLITRDGYAVTFSIPASACGQLGEALEKNQRGERIVSGESEGVTKLN